jgi:uncharacterized damage-inducible protein DinB
MTIAESLLPEYDQEMKSTRKILECVSDDKLSWKPHEKSMALDRLASHVAEFPQWIVMTLKTEKLELHSDFKPYFAASRAELLVKFDADVLEARAMLAGTSDEELGKMWKLTFGEKTIMEMPRVGVLRSMVMNHMIHHRAQLGVYLRLLDLPLPGMYGPSADEMSEFRT